MTSGCCRVFQSDLQDAMRLLQDPAGLKSIIRTIFEKHTAAALPATTLAEDGLQVVQRSVFDKPSHKVLRLEALHPEKGSS